MRVRGHEGLLKKRSTDSLLSSVSDVQSKTSADRAVARRRQHPDHHRLRGRRRGHIHVGEGRRGVQGGDPRAEGGRRFGRDRRPGSGRSDRGRRGAGSRERTAAPAKDPTATLAELAKLRDAGAISPAEYEAKKTEILSRI